VLPERTFPAIVAEQMVLKLQNQAESEAVLVLELSISWGCRRYKRTLPTALFFSVAPDKTEIIRLIRFHPGMQ
jgi:hypothetical protein